MVVGGEMVVGEGDGGRGGRGVVGEGDGGRGRESGGRRGRWW